MKIFGRRRQVALIYVLALVKFVLPFLLQHSAYEPHRDEFLYLAEARHMAWGYLELPPVLSALSLVTNAFGGGLFWIKFWPSLGGALTYVLVGRMILLLGGGRWALVLGFLPFVFGYFLHVHFMLQPNFLEMLSWTAMAYGLMCYVHTGRPKGLYMAGVAFGLGMLSKYSVAFFAGTLVLGLLLTPERKIFRNRHFYFALLTGLLLFLPNLFWQGSYGWPIANHMAELRQQQLDQVSRLNFLLDQLTYNLPGLAIWAAGLYWLFVPAEGRPYRFAGWAVLIVLAFLTLARGKSYYAMSAYPVLIGCGAVCLERATAARRGWRWGLVAFSVAVGCYLDTVCLPMLPPEKLVDYYKRNPVFRRLGFLRWEDQRDHPLPQDFADMLGWRELAQKTARVYHTLDSAGVNGAIGNGSIGVNGAIGNGSIGVNDAIGVNGAIGNGTILDGGNYGEAGALDYYGPALGLPPAMGHAANYLLWTPTGFYNHENFILTIDDRDELRGDFVKGFSSAKLADSVSMPQAREFGSGIILLKGPSAAARAQWGDYYRGLWRKAGVRGKD
jgi:hypothetical protein